LRTRGIAGALAGASGPPHAASTMSELSELLTASVIRRFMAPAAYRDRAI
jgi:hypothetical protein